MNCAPITLRCPFAAALCAGAALLCAASAGGDEVSLSPRKGVLLLTNGELLAGTIIPAGDRYDVHLETGEIRIRRASVAMVCKDAHECYLHQRDGIELGRASDHLDLAEWCLRNNLLDDGQRELTDARAADPAHPKLRLLETRLEMARRPPPEESEPETQASKTARPVAASPKLPPAAMENFAHAIQPLLLNYCAKGGCHVGSKASGFELERMHPRRISRSATQRNLERVLELVDRDQPRLSPLLQVPVRPHGKAKAVFTSQDQAQYNRLTAWVYAASQSGAAMAEKPDEGPAIVPATALMRAADETAPAIGESGPAIDDQASATLPDDASPQALEPTAAEKAYTPEQLRAMGALRKATSNVQVGADVPAAFTPKDDFDPEIFNRRFFSIGTP